jgi:NAD(P)-dependent dehydrogenase (short-subunit alcohol dehydrogenase family)
MERRPQDDNPEYRAAGKLRGKSAVITGGDSGIGRAVAIAFAKEGARVTVIYYRDEREDAEGTKSIVEQYGGECFLMSGDVGDEQFCQEIVEDVIDRWGSVDVLVNNAGEQHLADDFTDIGREQIEQTFQTNIFGQMFMAQAALPYMVSGSSVINTASVTAYHGNPLLIDYSASKGAIVSFTHSLSLALVSHGIRVNAVAPGPVWTPLIDATFPPEQAKEFGKNVPMGRAAQPYEIAPCYVFLASDDASYITGQVLHPNGGTIVNG